MKIYNKLIIDIGSGAVIEEDSFEYSGPLALCGGGSSAPAAPEKTQTEKDLDTEQLKLLQEQSAARREMEPFELEAMGYKRDDSGKIIKLTGAERSASQILSDVSAEKSLEMAGYDTSGNKLTEEQRLANMTDAEKTAYNVTKLTNQRQLDALEGKLPISPALEQALSGEEAQATEMLNRKLGKDWMLSTPGQSAMSKIKQKNELVREEARRGMITETEALSTSQANKTARDIAQANATTQSGQDATAAKLNAMMGYINGRGSGFDNSLTMSSKLASERANQQNLAMQGWQTKEANTQGTKTAVIGGTAMVAAAAAY